MSSHEDSGHGDRWELGFAICAGVSYLAALMAEFALGAPAGVVVGLYLATYFLGGFFTVRGAWQSIRQGRFEVDFLMIVAAAGAAAVGRFGEGAVLLFLFSLGHALEELALANATRSISALAELAPRTATVKTPAGTEQRPVEDLRIGEVIIVRPNSRVPADGFLAVGVTSIDQSAVTGESIPVEKVPVADPVSALASPERVPSGSRVFAGTVNGPGAIEVIVTASAADSTLSRVITLVKEADATASPTQLFIDRFQRYYVPSVIATVVVVLGAGLALGDNFADSFYRAMLVLVAASPCALAIATPAAVLAAIARAARAGVLVKGGAPMESLGKVDAIAFDKTGTLTWGHPQLTDVIAIPGTDPARLKEVAFAVESLSDHPLAGAIVRDLSGEVPQERLTASGLEAVTGRGLRAVVGDQPVLLGNRRLFTDAAIPVTPEVEAVVERLQSEGRTTMILRHGESFLGVLGVMDVPKLEATQTIAALRAGGIREHVMISGDNQQVADAIGRAVGIDRAVGELLPEDKVRAIQSLGSGGRVTCMVGDGVNDAPAMASASIGIAMGAAGSAVALETADIALMSDDLGRLPFIQRLSRRTTQIIRQNLIVALGMVAILVPASLLGAEMGPVVLLHEGSTILVVLNALRLLHFDHDRDHAGIDHEERPGLPA